MVLKDILSISGEPGLFKFLAQGKNSIIVEHLETLKRSSAHGSAKVSSLEDIAIFTDKEDMPLSKVFDLIWEKENGGPAIDPKTESTRLTEWFESVLPGYSRNKVYTSDIRKVAQWYNILHKLDLLVKEEPEKEGEEKETSENESEVRESVAEPNNVSEEESAKEEESVKKPGTGKKKPKS